MENEKKKRIRWTDVHPLQKVRDDSGLRAVGQWRSSDQLDAKEENEKITMNSIRIKDEKVVLLTDILI